MWRRVQNKDRMTAAVVLGCQVAWKVVGRRNLSNRLSNVVQHV
jgi:hypothetical protein